MSIVARARQRPVTAAIVLVCTIIFFFESALLAFGGPLAEQNFFAVFALTYPGLAAGRLWTPITYMFLHGSLLHLLFNMVTLWFVGAEMERILGRSRFLLLYLSGGVVGGLLQVFFVSSSVLIGASGGVFAVLLGFTTMFPNVLITALIFFVLPLRVRARQLGFFLLGFAILSELLGIMPGVGHLAHIGGGLVGIAFAYFYTNRLPWIGTSVALPGMQTVSRGFIRLVSPSSREVERIFAKVMREGLQSLTPTERAILERQNTISQKQDR
ncbi:MAG: rhomboid family intramembrane serine protease [Chthoniobacterales bacterium]